MSMTIQLLKAGDEAVLQAVAPDVFDDPIDPAAAAKFLADANHYLAVAIDDGVVIGFVSAVRYFHPDKPNPELWINEVGVAASHRGQGIARRLMNTVLEEARQQGCLVAWVLTNRSNTAAMRLYASSGGEEADDDIVMFEFKL
ncbi:MAG TPA: GNAT family N-acetyltransferase [Blastocatellia bacterium]|nr:GNAT family N-acetyltransferase [Blastocatellia bacterium]